VAKSSLSGRAPRRGELDWNSILVRAAEIVKSYDTGVTLRQLYYRLVSEGLIPNRQQSYKTLSSKSAAARREGWFPTLIDRTREIERFQTFISPQDAMEYLSERYLRDRTEGQEYAIYIGVEKHGLTTQLVHWFGGYGIPVLALGGYSSQTFVDEVAEDVAKDGRHSVLIYAGDFDPSGMDIDRDFVERGMCFDDVVRVALTAEIVERYDLPPMMGKATDSRSRQFMEKHGELVQVELDALPPDEMRKLYKEAIDQYWDYKTLDKVMNRESDESGLLDVMRDLTTLEPVDQAVSIAGQLDESDDLYTLLGAVQDRIDDLS